MIRSISERLFADPPRDVLYHYTSLAGLMGIVESRHLRASDVRFMNDSTELRHTFELLRSHLAFRLKSGADNAVLLSALLDWLSQRVASGPSVFAASFRANGNLLSQWRGYSVHGKGISLGFAPTHIARSAQRQDFQVGRCVYETSTQEALIEQIVDGVERASRQTGAVSELEFAKVFADIEEDLLRIAALLKHPAFQEEEEWRVVSPCIRDLHQFPVSFREGASMLVPYYLFSLTDSSSNGIPLQHVFVGPTSNRELSMTSISAFLDSRQSAPRLPISYCDIPYRSK